MNFVSHLFLVWVKLKERCFINFYENLVYPYFYIILKKNVNMHIYYIAKTAFGVSIVDTEIDK